jgi:hypothetical protein
MKSIIAILFFTSIISCTFSLNADLCDYKSRIELKRKMYENELRTSDVPNYEGAFKHIGKCNTTGLIMDFVDMKLVKTAVYGSFSDYGVIVIDHFGRSMEPIHGYWDHDGIYHTPRGMYGDKTPAVFVEKIY